MPMPGTDDSKYYYNNVVPKGEEREHTPFLGCKCRPRLRHMKGADWLFHYAFDKRDVWLSIEKFLGITCYEHGLFVSPLYVKGQPHGHFQAPPLLFEYDHKKIDPR